MRKAYQDNDALTELAAQIHKSQAVDWLLRNSSLVDPEGNAINADDLFGDESQGNSAE